MIQYILVGLVILSLLQACFELLMVWRGIDYTSWVRYHELTKELLIFTTVIFTIEYCVRIWCCVEEAEGSTSGCRVRIEFFFAPLNLLDFFSCAVLLWSLWMQTNMSGGAALRAGRSLRLVRFARVAGFVAAIKGGIVDNTKLLKQGSIRQRIITVMVYDENQENWIKRSKFKSEEDAFGFDAHSGTYFRLLLLLLSAHTGLFSFVVDQSVSKIISIRHAFCIAADGMMPAMLVDTVYSTLLLWCARLAVMRAPQAAGSGLPEVNCILSGIQLEDYLNFKVLMSKAFGLIFALSAALPVGKEGPFVHIAACAGACLLESRLFRNLSLSCEEVYLAAVAVGVGATFSAPVGGVLFALELMMPRLYDRSSYAACFFASTLSTLTYQSLELLIIGAEASKPLINTDLPRHMPYDGVLPELCFVSLCMLVGAICGTLGGLFVHSHRSVVHLINKCRGINPMRASGPPLYRDFIGMAIVACAGAGIRAYMQSPLFTLSGGPLLTKLFSQTCDDSDITVFLQLLAWNFGYILVAISMPVPAGVVAPSLVLGALLGRTIASSLPPPVKFFLEPSGDFSKHAAKLSIVGATCFCGSVCRVNSVVVTVFEGAAVPGLLLTLMLSTLTANFCGNLVGPSIFDSILVMKKIPAMPTLRASNQSLQSVECAVRAELMSLALPRTVTQAELKRVQTLANDMANEGQDVPSFFPIFDEVETGMKLLLGAVNRERLADIVVSDGQDFLGAVVAANLLTAPMQIGRNESLKEAYLHAKQSVRDGPLMVVEPDGSLFGILPAADLLKINTL